MSLLPSSIPAGATLLILVGDILIFVLIALTFQLLKPQKLSATIWVSPIFHLYTLFAVFLALYETLLGQSATSITSIAGSYGAFLVAALVGAVLGRVLGHRIPVGPRPEGGLQYTGGKLLVALLVVLLLPLGLEQAAVLFGAIGGVQALTSALAGAPPFSLLLLVMGSLFVLGTFLSLTWRFEVWSKRERAAQGAGR